MEKRIKILESQFLEVSNIIHGTVFEIERLEIEIVPLENSVNRLKHNIQTLKSNKIFVVSISVYSHLRLELSLVEMKYNKVFNLLEKYKNYLDNLIVKETKILDEISDLTEKMESQKKIIPFDLNRKKNGQN